MSLVTMSVGALLTVGLQLVTWLLVIAATVAAIASRLIYRGRKNPGLEGENHD